MRNKGISLLIPVLFLGMLLLVFSALSFQDTSLAQVDFQDTQHSLSLAPCYDETSGQYYLYLPSFTSEDALRLSCPWYMRAEIHSEASASPTLSLETDLEVTLSYIWGEKQTCVLRLMRCSARETVYLEAQDGMQDHLHEDQTHESEVFVTFLSASGETQYRGSSFLSGRGNGTWLWEKKPYDMRFSDPVSIGPFSEVDKLCLLAEYTDLSKLRNSLGYYAGQLLNIPYASDYLYADVYLNGQYQGLYGIATKQEFEKHIEEDQIQAVFELTTSGKGELFYTDSGKAIRTRYGDAYAVYDQVFAMEKALQEQDWDTLYQIIDLSSWARKFALEEFLYNYDMSMTSQYFYLDPDGVIHCMLPWDYEWTLYSRLYPYDATEEYALSSCWNRPNWYAQLLESQQFRCAVSAVLEQSFTQELLDAFNQYLANCEEETAGSWRCDLIRWNAAYSRSHTTPPGSTTQAEYREQFHRYFTARLDFLKTLLAHWDSYHLISFYSQLGDSREEAKLQLILPTGADLRPYHSRIMQSLAAPEGWELVSWATEDGQPLSSVTTVTGPLSIIAHYRSLPPEEATP